jgi:hypothetical protein
VRGSGVAQKEKRGDGSMRLPNENARWVNEEASWLNKEARCLNEEVR